MMSSGLMKTESMTAKEIWQQVGRCTQREEVVRAVLCRRSLTPNDHGGPGCNLYGKTGHVLMPMGDISWKGNVCSVRVPECRVAFFPDGWFNRWGDRVRPYPVTEYVDITEVAIPAWCWYPEAQ